MVQREKDGSQGNFFCKFIPFIISKNSVIVMYVAINQIGFSKRGGYIKTRHGTSPNST
jgi:hypothetical protein